jgi:hypothetical protein
VAAAAASSALPAGSFSPAALAAAAAHGASGHGHVYGMQAARPTVLGMSDPLMRSLHMHRQQAPAPGGGAGIPLLGSNHSPTFLDGATPPAAGGWAGGPGACSAGGAGLAHGVSGALDDGIDCSIRRITCQGLMELCAALAGPLEQLEAERVASLQKQQQEPAEAPGLVGPAGTVAMEEDGVGDGQAAAAAAAAAAAGGGEVGRLGALAAAPSVTGRKRRHSEDPS